MIKIPAKNYIPLGIVGGGALFTFLMFFKKFFLFPPVNYCNQHLLCLGKIGIVKNNLKKTFFSLSAIIFCGIITTAAVACWNCVLCSSRIISAIFHKNKNLKGGGVETVCG